MRFRSKIDSWFIIVLVVAAVVAVLGCIPVIAEGSALAFPLVAIILFSVLGLPIWLLAKTHYDFEDSDLVVHSGPFAWRIPLSQIRRVEPTRSMLSSPALSLDRLRIDYGSRGSIMVSPADKEGFLGQINARRSNPSLERP